MKKFTVVLLTLSMLLCACSSGGGSKDTSGTQSSTPTDSLASDKEPEPYVPDPSHPYAEEFFAPSSEYQWHRLKHSMPTEYAGYSPNAKTNYFNRLIKQKEGGIVTNVPFDSGFVDNDNHFANLNVLVKDMLENGLNVWLYDEQGYPSGTAGGRVTVNNPEYVAQGLTLIKKTGSGKNPVTLNKDARLIRLYTAYAVDTAGNVYDVAVTDDAVSFAGASGEWTLYVYALKEFYEGTHAEGNGYKGSGWLDRSYLNIMDRDAVASFINIAYKPYTEKFDYFDQIVAVFTDEPSLMMLHSGASEPYDQLAWAPGFEELFEEMHGYSITHKLHYMFGGKTEEARIVRTNYFQTVAKMVSENFFGQINDFCVEHGSQLGGHMFSEESVNQAPLYGDLMLCYREMGMPGVDILNIKRENYFPAEAMTVKTAASISRITDKENITMVELCALDINGTVAFSESERLAFWNVINYILFNGGNHINAYADINAMGKYKPDLANYYSRLSYFSRNAEWDGDIALYDPITTFQSYTMASGSDEQYWPSDMHLSRVIAEDIWNKGMDFLKIDNTFILEAEIKDGTLTNGHASFRCVIMPHVEVIPLNVLKKLIAFKDAGGDVYFVSGVPYLADRFEDNVELKSLAAKLTSCSNSQATSKIRSEYKYALNVNRANSNLYMSRYDLGGDEAYWLLNKLSNDKTYTATYEGAKSFEIYDPLTGEITYVEGDTLEFTITRNCALIIVVKK